MKLHPPLIHIWNNECASMHTNISIVRCWESTKHRNSHWAIIFLWTMKAYCTL